jgi:acyl carrier protein
MNEATSETGNGFIALGGDVIAAVTAVLAEKLGRPAAEIASEDTLESDLGIDSMTMIEVNIGLEERFHLTMPDFTEPGEIGVRKVKDLAAFVAARLADRPAAQEVRA